MLNHTRVSRVAGGAIVATAAVLASAQAPTPGSGPVAISIGRAPSALVLQADGRVVAFDTATRTVGSQVFRTPDGYQAPDLAAAAHDGGVILCLTLNRRTADDYASFVLQVLPDRRELWTWMPSRGVYVGVAVDSAAGYAYATNSTANEVLRIRLGRKEEPVLVARINDAERIGPIAVDPAGRRLFVAEIDAGRVYVVPIESRRAVRSAIRSLPLTEVDEARAVSWSPTAGRLFIADSGRESIWILDPERPGGVTRLKDKRLHAPAGLTVAPDGTVWVVDERARAAFDIHPSKSALGSPTAWKSAK